VTVTLYTKPGCPYCAAARGDLQGRGIDFVEIDVTLTPGAEEKLGALTNGQMVVPVLVQDGDVRVGFGGACSI
jgi:glutaredoxin 3